MFICKLTFQEHSVYLNFRSDGLIGTLLKNTKLETLQTIHILLFIEVLLLMSISFALRIKCVECIDSFRSKIIKNIFILSIYFVK